MPILPAEPDCFPPDLWDNSTWLSSKEDAVWRCLHTKPRQEKATARELLEAGVTYYLPQAVKESRTPQGRKIRAVVPLFAGYLFLHGDPHDRLTVLRSHRLVSVLEVVDQEALARDLRQIDKMLKSGLVVTPEPTMPVGATVRILTGPLTGITGKVIRRGKHSQFVAVVNFLRRGATVDLQDWQVELVE
jgi:transcription antitermination factor NusG